MSRNDLLRPRAGVAFPDAEHGVGLATVIVVGPEEGTAPQYTFAVAALVRELRPRQWLKNLACLAGLIFSGRLLLADCLLRSAAAVAAFCAAASAMYILNDYFDRDRDRRNPRTASRPLASGALPLWLAALAFGGLLAVAGTAATALSAKCAAVLIAYGVLNVLYSACLKQAVIADVMCIALGFVLRVLFGVYAVLVQPTAWVVLCMFFLALFLGFGKRKAELSALGRRPARARPVLRQYHAGFLDLMLAISAAMTLLCYALFTVAAQKNPTLVVTIIPVVYCMTRYLLEVTARGAGESPDALLLTDRRLWVGVLCWLGLCIAILYGDIQLFAHNGFAL